MLEIDIYYEGDLHCRAVHKPSGAVIQTDAPVDNHGRGENFSPTDLATAALGTCMATLMGIAAQQHGIDLKGTHVVVRKEMSKTPPRRIARFEVDYHVPLPANHPQRELLEAAARGCPVHHSLHPDIEQKIAFYYLTP
jgi:putative redox protein